MRTITLISFLFLPFLVIARIGDSCDDPIFLTPSYGCELTQVDLQDRPTDVTIKNYRDGFTGERFVWYAFEATSDKVSLDFEINNWVNIALLEDCVDDNGYTAISAFKHFEDSRVGSISYNNLTVGQTYFILMNTDVRTNSLAPLDFKVCLSPYKISPSDCRGALVICSDGNINFEPTGPGFDDFNQDPTIQGCLSGETKSVWYIFGIKDDAPENLSLSFNIRPLNLNADYDFALYGPNTTCENLGAPLRCSYANENCLNCPNTGLSATATDLSEDVNGDGFVAPITVNPGESYLLIIDNYDGVGDEFTMTWGGEAAAYLNCDVRQEDCNVSISDFSYRVNTQPVTSGDTILEGDNVLNITPMGTSNVPAEGTIAFAIFDANPDTFAADINMIQAYYPDENPHYVGLTTYKNTLNHCNGTVEWDSFNLSGNIWIVPIVADYYNPTTGELELDKNHDNCFVAGEPLGLTIQSKEYTCGESFSNFLNYDACARISYTICPDTDKWLEIVLDSFELESNSLSFASNGTEITTVTGNGKNEIIQNGEVNECIQVTLYKDDAVIDGEFFDGIINCYDPCPPIPTEVSFSGKNIVCAQEPFSLTATFYDSLSYSWEVPTGAYLTAGTDSNSIDVVWNDTSGNITLTITSECGKIGTFTYPITIKDKIDPVFDLDSIYCIQNEQVVQLPTTSDNNLLGAWTTPSFRPSEMTETVQSIFEPTEFCANTASFTGRLDTEPILEFKDTICGFSPELMVLRVDVDGTVRSSVGTVTRMQNGDFEISEIPFETAFELTIVSRAGCEYTRQIDPIECNPPCDIKVDVDIQQPTCNDPLGYIFLGDATGAIGPYFYSIDDGIPSFIQNFRNLEPGNHSVNVRDKYGCQFSQDVFIKEIQYPILDMPDTIQITTSQVIELPVKHNKHDSIIESITFDPVLNFECLNTPCSQTELRAKESFEAVVSFEDMDECLVTDSFYVWVIDKEDIVFNNIIQTGRGFNSYLVPYGNVDLANIELTVFDRWGGLVKQLDQVQLNQPLTGWDGKTNLNGDPIPTGIYLYTAVITYESGFSKVINGDVFVSGNE